MVSTLLCMYTFLVFHCGRKIELDLTDKAIVPGLQETF